ATSWSEYFRPLWRGFHLDWPVWLGVDYRTAFEAARSVADATARHVDPGTLGESVLRAARATQEAPHLAGIPLIFNLPAVAIVALITWVLVRGIRESAGFNTAMVVLKLVIVLFFVAVGAFYVEPANWRPFAPNGFSGIS